MRFEAIVLHPRDLPDTMQRTRNLLGLFQNRNSCKPETLELGDEDKKKIRIGTPRKMKSHKFFIHL